MFTGILFVVGFLGDCPLWSELGRLCASACKCLWVVGVYFWVWRCLCLHLAYGCVSVWVCACVRVFVFSSRVSTVPGVVCSSLWVMVGGARWEWPGQGGAVFSLTGLIGCFWVIPRLWGVTEPGREEWIILPPYQLTETSSLSPGPGFTRSHKEALPRLLSFSVRERLVF